jgi:hypothetical protein
MSPLLIGISAVVSLLLIPSSRCMRRQSSTTSFASLVWPDDVARAPTLGQTAVFIVDLRHPQHCAVVLQSLSSWYFAVYGSFATSTPTWLWWT